MPGCDMVLLGLALGVLVAIAFIVLVGYELDLERQQAESWLKGKRNEKADA